MNKTFLLGNLTKDIQKKVTQGGTTIYSTSIATSRKYKKLNGEYADEVMYMDLTLFGKVGEIAEKFLSKGSRVLIEGRLKFDRWKDADGKPKSKHSLQVINLDMVDSKRKEKDSDAKPSAKESNRKTDAETSFSPGEAGFSVVDTGEEKGFSPEDY